MIKNPGRFVAAYAPHAGYPQHVLELICDDIHVCFEKVCRRGYTVVIGIFLLEVGIRERLLPALCRLFNLMVTNADEHFATDGIVDTFESTTGLRRRLDFM